MCAPMLVPRGFAAGSNNIRMGGEVDKRTYAGAFFYILSNMYEAVFVLFYTFLR